LPELVLSDWKWVGLGPPAGIQLSNSRMLIPGYHTTFVKGDGEISKSHVIVSDDLGATWRIASESVGDPYFTNECQAVELGNKSVLINSRTLTPQRVQILSNDAGDSFETPQIAVGLTETIEGCEGSIVRDASTNTIYFSNPNNDALIRRNMTVFASIDEGSSWLPLVVVDPGATSYSALVITAPEELAILYERSDSFNLIFEPDQIVFWRVPLSV
jgi:sialidase-1